MNAKLKQNLKRKKLRSRAGTSLIETIISLSLLAVFIAGTSKMIMVRKQISDVTDQHHKAANLAKSRLELIRSFELDNIGQMMDFAEKAVVVNQEGQAAAAGRYRRSTTCTAVNSNVCEVVVDVEIRNRKTLEFEGTGETVTSYFYN